MIEEVSSDSDSEWVRKAKKQVTIPVKMAMGIQPANQQPTNMMVRE